MRIPINGGWNSETALTLPDWNVATDSQLLGKLKISNLFRHAATAIGLFESGKPNSQSGKRPNFWLHLKFFEPEMLKLITFNWGV